MLKLQMVQASVGRIIFEMLKPAMQWLAEKLKEVALWAKEHPTAVKAVFVALTAGIVAAGTAALAAAPAILAVSWPVLAIAAAVAAVSAAVYLLWQDWDAWTNGAESSLGTLWKAVDEFWDKFLLPAAYALGYVAGMFANFVDTTEDAWRLFVAFFKGDEAGLKTALSDLFRDALRLGANQSDMGHILINLMGLALEGIGNAVKAQAMAIFHIGASIGAGVVRSLMAILRGIYEFGKKLGANLADSLATVFEVALDRVLSKLGVVGGALKALGVSVAVTAAPGTAAIAPSYPAAVPTSAASVVHTASSAMAVHPSRVTNSSAKHSTTETHIGEINVHTAATNAQEIAGSIGGAIQSHSLVDQADWGVD